MTFPGSTWHHGIDLIAVERALLCVDPCPLLTEEEQRYAARLMDEAGWSASQIAGRLGVADRTVTRWRAVPGGGGA